MMNTQEEAILKLLYMSALSDHELHEIELDSIKAKLVTYPLFKTVTTKTREKVLSDLLGDLPRTTTDELLKEINNIIPDNLKETAYALALEVCAKDLKLHKDEIKFLKKVAKLFGISDDLAQALRKSVDVRYFATNN